VPVASLEAVETVPADAVAGTSSARTRRRQEVLMFCSNAPHLPMLLKAEP
jgi:hypothetical protein